MQSAEIVYERRDRFIIRWDDGRGSASIDISGFWSDDDVTDFLPRAADVMMRSRSRHGGAHVLFDLTKGEVLSGALFERVQAGSARIVQPQDRVAIVFASSLLKLQVKRYESTENTEFFISRRAADMWLHAHIQFAP
jgi:hypothetical protein